MFKYLVGITAASALRSEAGDAMGQLNGTYWRYQRMDLWDNGDRDYKTVGCVLEFHGDLATETTYAFYHGDPVNSRHDYVPEVEKIDLENRQLTLKKNGRTIVLKQFFN